mgnify:CR=1 FL=1
MARDDDRLAPEQGGKLLPRIVLLTALFLVVMGISLIIFLSMDPGGKGGPGDVPIVGAPEGPIKVPPKDPGGVSVPHQDKLVYGDEEEEVEHLLPSHEEPVQRDEIAELIENEGVVDGAETPEPGAEAPAEQPAPEPAAEPAAEPRAEPAPAPKVEPKPEPKPEPQPEPKPAPKAEPKPVAKSVSVPSGSWKLQLASFKTRDGAEEAWAKLQKNRTALLGDLGADYQSVDLGAKGTFHRLRAGPFGTRADAEARCVKLKAAGQDCLIVAPGK